MAKQVSGRRVYVTFIKDGTIAIHPSNCRSERYRMRGKGSIHVSKNVSAAELGRAILRQPLKTHFVIASEAKQSQFSSEEQRLLRRYAPRNDNY